jgi:hypothetical protein
LRWIDRPVCYVIPAMLALLPAMANAEVLVVRAIGPSAGAYRPGRSLADNARIILQPGDQLTLLDNLGTRTLNGPGSFAATGGGAPRGGASTLDVLLGQRGQQHARMGAVRGLTPNSEPLQKPNIFVVDIAQSGTVCLIEPKAATLWRGDAFRPGTMTITGTGSPSMQVSWGIGQSSQPWPSALPLGYDTSYRFSGLGTTATVRVKLLNSAPADLRDMAAKFIAAGCQNQLDTLITTANRTAARVPD